MLTSQMPPWLGQTRSSRDSSSVTHISRFMQDGERGGRKGGGGWGGGDSWGGPLLTHIVLHRHEGQVNTQMATLLRLRLTSYK